MDGKTNSSPYPQEVLNKVLNISITVDELVVLTDLATGYMALGGKPDYRATMVVHKFHEIAGIELGEGMLEREEAWRQTTNPINRR